MFQVNVFHVVHHVRDAAKGAGTLLIRILFVANTKYALRLAADKGDLHGRREGVRTRTFYLHRSFVAGEDRGF